jgi:GNAT superfamily N-acetyltransferase
VSGPAFDPAFRLAGPTDAAAVARLHADSWRRHYRGAYADGFLDGDVGAERLASWTERLRRQGPSARTTLAEHDGQLIGFAHVAFGDDPAWGALLENIHVALAHQRHRIGSALLYETAEAVAGRDVRTGLYLWVLEQNLGAQAFYEACGGRRVEKAPVPAPGGIESRLSGSPARLRYVWDDVTELTARRAKR